jgi:signal transduction histidine kinase
MRWRIRYQLLVPCLVLLVGVVGVSIWMALDTAERARRQIETRVRDVAHNLSVQWNYPLKRNVLEQMKRLSGADYLVLTPAETVSTLDPPPEGLPPADAMTDKWENLRLGPQVHAGGQSYLCSGIRLNRPTQPQETLYILYPETLWRDALWDALKPVLVLGGSFGLASVALALGLGVRLSRRVREVERRTRLIAAGDFGPMPLPAPNDEIRDLALSVNDMAERLARFHETTRRTERLRLLGQVGGGLAHQLRNGLAGARLALQLFLQENAGVTDTAALDVALRQLTLLETNLKRFLDLGRGGELRRADCSLTALVNEAVELLRPRCRHAGIDLSWQPPEDAVIVSGDTGQLGQMVLNLVSNAIEAAGPSGRVMIELQAALCNTETANGQSPDAVLEVTDTGPGPPPEIADRLFEPFVTGKPEGVGLGLAVSQQIAEAHGGRITWRRDADRTCFRVELPMSHSSLVMSSSKALG